MKTIKVIVILDELRVEDDDDETVRTALKDALLEAIEDDSLDYTVEEVDED